MEKTSNRVYRGYILPCKPNMVYNPTKIGSIQMKIIPNLYAIAVVVRLVLIVYVYIL